MATISRTLDKRVREILEKFPRYRDNELKLIATVWLMELEEKGIDAKAISAMDMLKMCAEGEVSRADSITRQSRMIQTKSPELRGETYRSRRTIEEPEYREDLKIYKLEKEENELKNKRDNIGY